MALSEYQKTLRGTSGKRVRAGLKGWTGRRRRAEETAAALRSAAERARRYERHETEHYGGHVHRTVIREPFSREIAATEIAIATARWECSGTAIVIDTEGTEFEGYEGYTVRALLEIPEMFYWPSFAGAVNEILDAGCRIKTKKAFYRLGTREVREAAK